MTERIAILGGGAAGLATAFALTEKGGYEITVYQMGWRLGGKGATGRRLDDGSGRDQEHGLHVLGGFYHNAMGMLRKVYEAWGKVSPRALDFDEVFIPQSLVHVMEDQAGVRFPVKFPFPPNHRPLGRDPQDLNIRTIAETILRFIHDKAAGSPVAPRGAPYAIDPEFRESLQSALQAASPPALRAAMVKGRDEALAPFEPDLTALDRTLAIVQRPQLIEPPPNAEHDPDFGLLFEIGLIVAKGIMRDGLWWSGFDAANDEEFTDWMRRHGLSERAIASSYFRCGYDYAFAYLDGDPKSPSAAAGAALRGFLRMVFTYNCAVFVHMLGGMGEVVFTPLYEVLKSRGVRFEFFHRVDRLELDDDGRRLRRIVMTVQNEPTAGSYDPLLEYKPPAPHTPRGVWPDRPIDARLKHHPNMSERAEFLYENPWQRPDSSQPAELLQDRDFDQCVLAIPVGALGLICDDLVAKYEPWRLMLTNSATTPTLAAQLWQAKTTAQLGWPNGPTVLTANKSPLSTWADMSYLLKLEHGASLRHLSYFCGPFPRAYYQISPADSDIGPPEFKRGCAGAADWLETNLKDILPDATPPSSFAAQQGGAELYVRVNSFPSEEYVLTPPGTVDFRLPPGGSLVENLFLAGDWTKNGYDIGSFETAVLSGLICARMMTGGSAYLCGERDVGM